MKKLCLLIFLIASVIVSAKTLVSSNSLSPPQSLDVKFVPQLSMLQITCETSRLNAVLFECDVSCNFSVLVNQNNARSYLGTSDMLKNEAISPACRAVITSNFSQSVIARNDADLIEAVSPNCRTVLSYCVINSQKCLIAAISPACRDVLFVV